MAFKIKRQWQRQYSKSCNGLSPRAVSVLPLPGLRTAV
nr:MAG TPA: hypothetical protein [Caudoviricetes sp.]